MKAHSQLTALFKRNAATPTRRVRFAKKPTVLNPTTRPVQPEKSIHGRHNLQVLLTQQGTAMAQPRTVVPVKPKVAPPVAADPYDLDGLNDFTAPNFAAIQQELRKELPVVLAALHEAKFEADLEEEGTPVMVNAVDSYIARLRDIENLMSEHAFQYSQVKDKDTKIMEWFRDKLDAINHLGNRLSDQIAARRSELSRSVGHGA